VKKIATILFSIYVIILFIIFLIISFPLVLIIICLPKKMRDIGMFHFLRIISNLWLYSCFIFPNSFNAAIVDVRKSYVIIANHASYLDAPVLYSCIQYVFKTLGKEELAKVPIFKYIYTSAVITVNRGSNMARAKSFINMQQTLAEGLNVVFFPEGTFDEQQDKLKPFFDGAFHLAIKAQQNILPLLLIDTNKRMKPNTIFGFTPGQSRTIFLPEISTKGLAIKDADALKNYCYHYMNSILQDCKLNGVSNFQKLVEDYQIKNPFII
jgi:1-acyl-sn-glycerol-3-phosphate acyltransferase